MKAALLVSALGAVTGSFMLLSLLAVLSALGPARAPAPAGFRGAPVAALPAQGRLAAATATAPRGAQLTRVSARLAQGG